MSLINKIKALFSENEEGNTEQTFIDAKTVDGKIMRVDELQPEQKVQEVTEDGLVDVEAGTYELEGGIEVVVGEGSIVSEVREVEVTEETEETEEFETVEETEETVEEVFTDLALKDGPIAHVIAAKSGEINVNDKLMLDGVEASPNQYETADGKMLLVGENGVIQEVQIVSQEEETTEEEEVVVENEVVEEVVEDPIENLTKKIEELTVKLTELTGGFEKVTAENQELKLQIQEFSNAPADVPTKTNVDFKKADRASKIEFFSKR